MLGYFISQSNYYTIRTEDTGSNEFTMSLTDMMGLNTFTASMSGIDYTAYENILQFTASISGTIVAGEYRATIDSPPAGTIWHGSIQVFASQSVDKAVYENKNTQYISHESENKYIIYN
jgi:hypothetical protein